MITTNNKPRLLLKCAYGLATLAYFDSDGVRRLEISHAELERWQKLLKKKLKRDSTMLELFEHVREATLQ